jgi:O-antigen biosynthesis protein
LGGATPHYRLTNQGPRRGVVFYARPSAPRRAYDLGVLALERFHRDHPEVAIHLFGERVSGLPFPATVHGRLRPEELGELYNRCAAGLALSMTNLSLIPVELLAAGCVPVVNDAPHNRALLDNPHVRWAQPSPRGLAEGLAAAVAANRAGGRAATMAASVAGASWTDAGDIVERALLRELAAEAPERRAS